MTRSNTHLKQKENFILDNAHNNENCLETNFLNDLMKVLLFVKTYYYNNIDNSFINIIFIFELFLFRVPNINSDEKIKGASFIIIRVVE